MQVESNHHSKYPGQNTEWLDIQTSLLYLVGLQLWPEWLVKILYGY